MSISRSIFSFGFPPTPDSQPSSSSEARKPISISFSSSSSLAKNHDRVLFWDSEMILKKHYRSRRRFLVRNVVQPGAPPPSEPPFNLINWIVGIAVTVVLPFFSNKWTKLIRIKNEMETAVEIAEEIVEAVEKVAEGVEKAAENIAEDLPEGGGLRKAVDFVEHVAERANKDAHILGDYIDKVQEVEEKVEDCVESLVEDVTNHEHHREVDEENGVQKKEEDGDLEPPKEDQENINHNIKT